MPLISFLIYRRQHSHFDEVSILNEWQRFVRYIAGFPLHFLFMHSTSEISSPFDFHAQRYSLLNLVPMPVAFCRLWSCFLKDTLFQMNRRASTKKTGVDHCSRKWNVNLLLILTIKWEENLVAVEAIHKYYGCL